MAAAPSITEIQFENLLFPAVLTPPGSSKSYFLGGAGPFEKLIRGSKIRPLSGVEYSKKVMENCAAHMKSVGVYGDAEAAAILQFAEAFKNVDFKAGASVFYRQSPLGFLALSFSEDGNMPEKEAAVIENKALSSAVLETMIGEHAVSPDLKRSLAERLPAILQKGIVVTPPQHN
ncbi:hypothetical protein PIB30_011616 [Stylosanthes scabra]|uniref:Chalcone-flavonone isomerase family protein n=1 Tax=Stylosanthes scabra TaxID=79078 RepID=A0ABU6V4B1_9FABA|nr:hypothetical protein [Stylosanthes scabra]